MPNNRINRRAVLLALAIAVVVLAVYARTRAYDFVNVDDDIYVYKNPHIIDGASFETLAWAFTTDRGGMRTPLTWYSFALNNAFHGLHPGGYHLTNVFLHMAGSVLLFLILAGMTSNVYASAFAASLFALHPLHVESVAWITERKDVLSGFFWMLSIGAYGLWYVRKPGILRYCAVFLFFLMSLMSKPMTVSLPAVLLLLDYWPLDRLKRCGPVRLVLEKLPLFALAVAAGLLNIHTLHVRGSLQSTDTFSAFARFGNAIVSYVVYIYKLFVPTKLAVFYPHPGESLPLWKPAAAFLLLAALTLMAVRYAKNHPYFIIGWLWYLGVMFPVAGFFQTGLQARADRFTYLPFIGLYIALSWGVPAVFPKLFTRRRAVFVVSGAVVAACMLLSVRQLSFWKNSLTLNEHAVAVTDGNFFSLTSLGDALVERGRHDEAIEKYREALAVNPRFANAAINLGNILMITGKKDQAKRLFDHALAHKPTSPEAYYNLGLLSLMEKDYVSAEGRFERALELRNEYVDAMINLGVVKAIQGKQAEAISHLSRSLALAPGNIEAMKNLAVLYARTGQTARVDDIYRDAMRFHPGNAELIEGLRSLTTTSH